MRVKGGAGVALGRNPLVNEASAVLSIIQLILSSEE